jgi:hypothetical protein
MKCEISGISKRLQIPFKVLWEDGKILETDSVSTFQLIKIEDWSRYGKLLGHPVGECLIYHSHIEFFECFSSLIDLILEPDYKVKTTLDNGEIIDGWLEYEFPQYFIDGTVKREIAY